MNLIFAGIRMKMLTILTFCCCCALAGGEKIFLNPSSEVGVFRRRTGEWHNAVARLQLSYSSNGLELKGELNVPEGRSFKKASGDPDDEMTVFRGEVFEFQVAPAGQDGIYYHFGIGPSGRMYTARCRDAEWNPRGAVLESSVFGRRWKFNLTVPFSDLNTVKPEPGTVWRINLARTDASSGAFPIVSSHSGAGDFHDITQYSEVVFGREVPADASILLKDVRFDHDILHFVFSPTAGSWCPRRILLEFSSGTDFHVARTADVTGDLLSVAMPLPFRQIPLKESIPAKWVVKDAETGQVLNRSSGFIYMPPAELQLDRFYYTESDREIRFSHHLSGLVNAGLYDSFGKKCTSASGNSISLAGLKPGRYVLEVSNDRVRISKILFLLPKKPAPGPIQTLPLKVRNGRLFRGDRPIFLLGLSPTPKSFIQLPDAFNLSYNHAGVQKNAVALEAIPGGKMIRKPSLGRIFPPEEEYVKHLGNWAKTISPRPARIWRISYEAQIPRAVKRSNNTWEYRAPTDFMKRIYRELKRINPELIYTIHTDRPSGIRDFSTACDVFEIAFYSSSYAPDMMPHLRRDMLQVKREAAPGKPVIFWLGGTIPNTECRTAEEIRAGVYLSVMHGFSGNIIHMGHGFLPERRSRLWSLLSGIHAEIENFQEDFSSGLEIPVPISEPFAGKAVKTASGEILLLVVNLSPADAEFRCDFPGMPEKELFTGYEPKLYRLPHGAFPNSAEKQEQ